MKTACNGCRTTCSVYGHLSVSQPNRPLLPKLTPSPSEANLPLAAFDISDVMKEPADSPFGPSSHRTRERAGTVWQGTLDLGRVIDGPYQTSPLAIDPTTAWTVPTSYIDMNTSYPEYQYLSVWLLSMACMPAHRIPGIHSPSSKSRTAMITAHSYKPLDSCGLVHRGSPRLLSESW